MPDIKATVPPETPGTISAVPMKTPFKNRVTCSEYLTGPGEAIQAFLHVSGLEAKAEFCSFFSVGFLGIRSKILLRQDNVFHCLLRKNVADMLHQEFSRIFF